MRPALRTSTASSALVTVVSAVALALASGGLAHAATPVAEFQNDRGKALYKERRFEEAAAAFRQASSMDPDPRYSFNLCVALEKLARWDEALAACDEVFARGANDALKAKAGERAAALRRARAQAPAPVPGAPPGSTSQPSVPLPPPGPAPEVPTPEDRAEYRWALGLGLGSAFRGGYGDNRQWKKNGSSFELHLDAYVLPRWRVGVRALLAIRHFVTGGDPIIGPDARRLQTTDVGAAAYLHLPLGKVVFTPEVGLQVGAVQPSTSFTGEPIGVASVRFGGTFDLVRGHHVFSLGPTFTAYLPTELSDPDPIDFPDGYEGLDKGGVTVAVNLGYTYRFTTIGIPGLISLE